MTFTDYQTAFDDILNAKNTNPPYDDEHYLEYTKLNSSRQYRWLKKGILSDKTIATIQSITTPQTWNIITEPWCGDAAHSVPFIVKMAELNPNIELNIMLRDGADSEIENYLTNGGKSIPKLIIRDSEGKDLIVWGPRPEACQAIFLELRAKKTDLAEEKIAIQKWYNEDKGAAVQHEISGLLNSL